MGVSTNCKPPHLHNQIYRFNSGNFHCARLCWPQRYCYLFTCRRRYCRVGHWFCVSGHDGKLHCRCGHGNSKPFEIGDVIEAEGVFGNVKEINLRNTLVETFYGQLEVIPNKILFRNILTNYSYLGYRRIEIPVGISYADDIEEAAKVITDAMNEKDYVIKKEETAVYAESFGDSSINLLLWFWIRYPGEPGFMVVRHDAITTVKTVLEDNDILIPFPIRTLDFNAKGSDKLNTMLS